MTDSNFRPQDADRCSPIGRTVCSVLPTPALEAVYPLQRLEAPGHGPGTLLRYLPGMYYRKPAGAWSLVPQRWPASTVKYAVLYIRGDVMG